MIEQLTLYTFTALVAMSIAVTVGYGAYYLAVDILPRISKRIFNIYGDRK